MVGFVSQYEGNKLTSDGFVKVEGEIASEKAPRCKMKCAVTKNNIDTSECKDQEVVENNPKYNPQIPMSDKVRRQHERHKAASAFRFVGLRANSKPKRGKKRIKSRRKGKGQRGNPGGRKGNRNAGANSGNPANME